MRRRLLAAVLAVAALLALPALSQAKTRYVTGISDQDASTFTNPLYTQLGMRVARYITPYDVMFERPSSYDRQALEAWIRAAQVDGQDVLISFEHSHVRGRGRHIPSAREYTRALQAFLKAYPTVKSFSPWNEVNRCSYSTGRGSFNGQPICRQPRMAATYYNIAVKQCKRCRIVALDVLDGRNVGPTVSYIRAFLRYARPFPKIWGLHNYSDTNRFSDSRTRALMRATRRGDIWLTETGGQVKDGRNFPYNPRRAARAIACTFTIANRFSRIKRVYFYTFTPGRKNEKFDGGLINPNGTRRPGWYAVKSRKAGPCRP